ncbi:MAG TPA: hypothetical protein P5311_00975 [Candidatus Dojkabacteria bacterium]|nr:hypothetical protein [Candidatus Dojkabacteria bacterium]
MNDKVITLPDADDMLHRLIEVDDINHLQERFYPLLLRNAGEEKVATGVVMMITLAIHDYSEGMPPMIQGLMSMNMENYLKALIDDEEVLQEAIEFFQEVKSMT